MGLKRAVKGMLLGWLTVTLVFPPVSLFQVRIAPPDEVRAAAQAPPRVVATKLDAGLSAILYRVKQGDITPGSEIDSVIKRIEKRGGIDIHLRAVSQLTPVQISAIEAAGVKLDRDRNGTVARLGRFYSASVPLGKVQELASFPFVSTLETSFWPPPKLHITSSVPATRADMVWRMTDSSGQKLTGKGVTIGVHDTGVDQFHPDFFRNNPGDSAQSPKAWLDLGQPGFNNGEDYVDLNGNGQADPGEGPLRWINASGARATRGISNGSWTSCTLTVPTRGQSA